jgi:hypothetical protein
MPKREYHSARPPKTWIAKVVATDAALAQPEEDMLDALLQLDIKFNAPDINAAADSVNAVMRLLVPQGTHVLLRIEHILLDSPSD